MPKLDKKTAKAVDEAEEVTGGFEPHPAGLYVATLKEVEARTAQSSGAAMWGIEMENLKDLEGNSFPGRQFTNLVLPGDDDEIPDSYKQPERSVEKGNTREEAWESRNAFLNGKMKRFFNAFEMTLDSDTDEMIGERCIIKLAVKTAEAGKRKGELVNEIDDFRPLSSVDFEDDASGDGDDDF